MKTRPPETSKPAPSADERDDAAIRRLVTTYGRAIESKDLALFRSVKPNLSADEERRLQQGFRAVTSQRVQLTIASIDRRGDTATVVVQRRDELDVGGRRQTVEARQVLTLGRAQGRLGDRGDPVRIAQGEAYGRTRDARRGVRDRCRPGPPPRRIPTT